MTRSKPLTFLASAALIPVSALAGRPAEEVIDRELVVSRVSALHDPRPVRHAQAPPGEATNPFRPIAARV